MGKKIETKKIIQKKEKSYKKHFVGIFVAVIIAISYNYFNQTQKAIKFKERPTYMLYDTTGPKSQVLLTMEKVLNRLGLQKIEVQSRGLKPENVPMTWDLFWCWRSHVSHNLNWSKLKPHQKINHWPGNYHLVIKSLLSTNTDSKYVPKGFLTAESVREYAKKHPEKKFVIKSRTSRGIKLVDPKDMNFIDSPKDYFAQELVQNPLLWNGHKFEFSIWVAMTSVNPLRIYYYTKNFLVRFCSKPYNISNPDDLSSYVISDDLITGQNFEPVKKFVDTEAYSYRSAFDEFITSKGVNVDDIWWKVEDLIRSIAMSKESLFIKQVSSLKKKFV